MGDPHPSHYDSNRSESIITPQGPTEVGETEVGVIVPYVAYLTQVLLPRKSITEGRWLPPKQII